MTDLGVAPERLATAPPFVRRLLAHGDRPALVAEDGTTWTYEELAERVAHTAAALGPTRRLVLLAPHNEPGAVVAELAALAGGHPVLVAPPGSSADELTRVYDPDVVVGPDTGWQLDERRSGTAHALHRDLAMLLCTSGSTGSAKVVRLSGANLDTNAAAIAAYLGLADDDVAVTSLPLSYCYGLSVLHSHLAVGAGIVLTDGSVVDPCFWERFRRHGCTGLAAVPHTFDLLDRAGFAGLDLPHLRRITQAGGRLAPEVVQRYARLGREAGWDLVVMYGQTEATARMAWLPPELAEHRPTAIGRPIPGGSLRVEPVAGQPDGVGELVYTGPNVMLGYAEGPGDLALGRTVGELRTGDLGRLADDGLFEVVGRASRFVKLFGLRIDLDRAEALLAVHGIEALATGDDTALVVAVRPGQADEVAPLLAGRFGIPSGAVQVVEMDEWPRTSSGKPDLAAVRAQALARATSAATTWAGADAAADVAASVDEVFRSALGVADVADGDSFASLGGDSLSYVEVSLGVERVLGHLPTGWHVMPLAELRAARRRPRRLLAATETTVVVRALAMVLIVGSHIGLFGLEGGAHVLLAVAGYNMARFALGGGADAGAPRRLLAAAGRVVLPCVAFIGAVWLVDDRHTWANVALVNNYLADGTWRYWYWFVEVLVQVLALVALVLCVPAARRWERRAPFGFALGVLGVALALRFVPFGDPANQIYRTHTVLWLFALGWAAARARSTGQRLAVTALALVTVPGFFATTWRDVLVIGGVGLLVWVREVPVPRPLAALLGPVAAASLAIYLTHWHAFPRLVPHLPLPVVLVAVLGIGVAAWALARTAWRVVRQPAARRDTVVNVTA